MSVLLVFLSIHYKNTDTGFSEQFKSWKGRSIKMKNLNKKRCKSLLVIGAMTLIVIGVGLVFFEKSPLLIVASILLGVGLGLVVKAIILRKKKKN